ncbi:glycogen synthase GlgA [Fuerstiella marisgermanici]|uniref:Glycogen synthase n=1 Tax=Fuerstiella marisgermanici TaxID=1891926 RepID=A0A1P8WID7_9PLAN|nr:glycogen synthase GlgA [Fuerstiella marisgermanici]APZ93818.1 Glycogen synthase [Fuerstiella marisgermanici]
MLTSDRMRIVMAASEAVPFSKTGGLADVSTALAKALDALGHDVTIIIPDYRELRLKQQEKLPTVADTGMRFSLSMNGRYVNGGVNWTMLPDTSVKVLMISQPYYFDRPQLYMEAGEGYRDSCERYCFFSRAVLEVCQQMVLRPDIIHCNDWQTGLIPALLHAHHARRPGFENAASVMTLHNMAYQGRFWHLDMHLTAMEWRYFNMRQMEMFGDLNLLKTGIAFADQVTTVSPTYAKEICSPEGGEGLDSLLTYRNGDLVGILNGIDDTVWDPSADPHLPAHYSTAAIKPGKAECKAALQKRVGLPDRPNVPLFGMVSRMSDQKGLDLLADCADRLLFHDIQMVFLGTGDPHFENFLQHLAEHNPGKVAAVIGFDDGLAHQIEAGVDSFLMPSRFEPCGLNQMYSLRYGTLPVVRLVGGLADSVVDVNPATIQDNTATGFVFEEYSSTALAEAVERAVEVYRQPDVWHQLMINGMSIDWSWHTSAMRYADVYRQALERRHDRANDGRE